MKRLSASAVVGLLAFGSVAASQASRNNFTGNWEVDLRSQAERQAKAECGRAFFKLKQVGNKIQGEHSFATVGCGRLNEGGEGTVEGSIHGGVATLVVTSGRNGAVVRGTAKLEGPTLVWQTLKEIKPGTSSGDSALILDHGVLHKVSE
jgi:hypothetical protein